MPVLEEENFMRLSPQLMFLMVPLPQVATRSSPRADFFIHTKQNKMRGRFAKREIQTNVSFPRETRRRAEVNAALIHASATGDIEGVDELLREGADVRADGNAALKWASRSGHVAVVYRLLQVPGMSVHDVVAQDNYALKTASENGHAAVVDRLLQVQGITADDVRAEDNFALKSARRNGHAAVVNLLSDALREIEWASRNETALQVQMRQMRQSE